MKVVVVVALVVAEVCSGQQDPFTLPDFAGSPLPLPVAVDPNVEVHLNILSAVSGALVNYETPIALRLGSLVDTLVWNCAASYHDAWLDALTLERPVTAVPDRALHTSDSRVLCSAQCLLVVFLWRAASGAVRSVTRRMREVCVCDLFSDDDDDEIGHFVTFSALTRAPQVRRTR
mmetsp:Transcript_22803/g.73334  ORF Transcript_22803/g.73334 Transcript_22803/m.73334 type:complete len:175 (-) Transcript_22803:188-712(-)